MVDKEYLAIDGCMKKFVFNDAGEKLANNLKR